MTPDDRELLVLLRRQQADLQRSLAHLDARLEELESRARAELAVAAIPPPPPMAKPPLPPIPTENEPILPAIPLHAAEPPPPPGPALPPLPTDAIPALRAPLPPVPRHSFEMRFGRALFPIGVTCGVFTLALILSLTHTWLFKALGPAGIIGFSGILCVCVVIAGSRVVRRTKNAGMRIIGRSLEAMGLAGLYVTFYAAHYFPSVAIVTSPVAAGLLLLAWSIYVLSLAARENSQALALFAILLAYFTTAINPVGRFSMAADLLLAGSAVFFLWRNGWGGLSWIALLGTNYALLRRLVIDENGDFSLETAHGLPFGPYAVYLLAAWGIFTAAVFLTRASSFSREKRLALLTLNNGALALLLCLTTYVAGFGARGEAWTLFWLGIGLIVTAMAARVTATALGIAASYLAQGLTIFTFGLMGLWSGVTRGVLLLIETFFLGTAASATRGVVLRFAAGGAAFFATAFLLWEIGMNSHDPWRLGLAGLVVMLINAWFARRDIRADAPDLLPGASYYVALALILLATTMATKLSDHALPPALAAVALVLTFSIYVTPLLELAVLGQSFLLGAQALVLFPAETGESMPPMSTLLVAAITLALLVWWPRQRAIRTGPWLTTATFVYALALVGLAWHALRPGVSDQNWMAGSALLAFTFLLIGAWSRTWPLAAMGQVFLLSSLCYFFSPESQALLGRSWVTGAVPIAVVYVTGRAIHAWLIAFPNRSLRVQALWHKVGTLCQWLALGMIIDMIVQLVPVEDQLATFLIFGTALVAWNSVRGTAAGIRAGFVPTLIGIALVFYHVLVSDPGLLATLTNGLALFALLLQPAFLRISRQAVSEAESWIVVILSAATGWVFVDAWVDSRLYPNDLTMGWAVYALALFLLGLFVHEKRQRWCGLFVLAAAILRVLVYDIWGFSNGYKVLTFVVLTFITLGLGFLYARLADRLKTRH
jgi:hypothetical protein